MKKIMDPDPAGQKSTDPTDPDPAEAIFFFEIWCFSNTHHPENCQILDIQTIH